MTDPTNGLTFPNLNAPPFGGEEFTTNLIMPEPCPFLSRRRMIEQGPEILPSEIAHQPPQAAHAQCDSCEDRTITPQSEQGIKCSYQGIGFP
jgi:hypothetical protein